MTERLPEDFLEEMKQLLKEDYDSYLASFSDERAYGIRVNTAKVSLEDFERICPFKVEKIPFISNGYYYDPSEQPGKHPYYHAGLYYIQEPSAMLPAEILPVEEGDIVLDGCAAPGGKSTQIGCKPYGLLISNDISASRCQGMLKNIELAGMKNYIVMSEDLTKIDDRFEEMFDAILIDAPCSGQGMFRRDPSLISSYVERGSDYYQPLQKAIAAAALKMLRPGGKMVYSTCTFSIKENEEVIEYLKQIEPDLHVIDAEKRFEGFSEGIVINGDEELRQCIRLYPHKIKGEGHFVALLQKGTGCKNEKHLYPVEQAEISEEAQEFLDLSWAAKDSIMSIGDRLIQCAELMPDTRGLRVLRSGVLIGEMKKKRFVPYTGYALSLDIYDFDNVLVLKCEDPRTLKYLKGETISSDVDDGFCLIAVDGFPLGFGKASNGMIKNLYEPSWRML